MRTGTMKKKIFGVSILFLMLILAVGTLVSFAEDETTGSYTLTINKVFADGAPAEAADQTFTFRVEAMVKKSGASGVNDEDYEPEEQIVKITGPESKTIEFSNAFKISAIEQTTPGGFIHDDEEWNVTGTYCESAMHVSASKATVHISKDNGSIRVTRAAGLPAVTFKLTGVLTDPAKQEAFDRKYADQTFTVNAGDTVSLGDALPAGQYTITKLRAEDGFSVLVGKREFDVDPGKTGTVRINSDESKLSIKAPAAAADSPILTHHYKVTGIDSSNAWVEREIDVRSGETGTLEHLAEGTYTIQVSRTYEGKAGYTVKYPDTTMTKRTQNVDRVTTSETRSYKGYSVKDKNGIAADQVEVYGFGPLYDAKGNKIVSQVTYQVNWGIHDGSGVVRNYTQKSERSGSGSYTLNKLNRLCPTNGFLYFTITGVSNSAVQSIDLRWREYREKEVSKEFQTPSSDGNVVAVNGLTENYITLSKPADESDPRADKVKYYYTITDSNGTPITGFTVVDGAIDEEGDVIATPTDNEGTTVMLKAGETVTIQGLHAGNYRIKEEVDEPDAMGFHVTLEDTRKKVTTPNGTIEIETLDERSVEIQRPGNPADDNGRVYTYEIYQADNEGRYQPYRTVTLQAGEKTTVAEQTGSMLPAGKYKIVAVDDQVDGFDVTFSDSSSLTSNYIKKATVTFTNTFSAVQASYHVVHEYYLKNSDGSYTFEGASPVYTKNCDGKHDEGGGHSAEGVHKLEVYGGHEYTYLPDAAAYGKVVSWPKGDPSKEVPLEEDVDKPNGDGVFVPDPDWVFSNGSDSAEDPGTRDYAYVPLDNLTHATAQPHDGDGTHSGAAQIIILRYFREDTALEHGKYNVIHVYYRRTADGDQWDGSSALETIDVGRLTQENPGGPYDAGSVEPVTRFTPEGDVEYPYVYDSAAYGKLVSCGNSESEDDKYAGEGKAYRQDDAMTSVMATTAGDQVIILRYYRSGGYKVVHEYYYREKAETAGDSGEVEETPGEDTEGDAQPEDSGSRARDGETGGFSGTLSDSDGYAYTFEGKSDIVAYSAKLESRHDAGEVQRVNAFTPEDGQRHNYTAKDAVYGYADKDGTYRMAPYMTGVSATAQEDEIIILRYYREDTPGGGYEEPEEPSGREYAYRVIHEYYFEDASGKRTLEGKSGVSLESGEAGRTYDESDVAKRPDYNGRTYKYQEDAYGSWSGGQNYAPKDGWSSVRATESGEQIIILRYVRTEKQGGYQVIHEYYFRGEDGTDTLEGRSGMETVDGLPLDGTRYTADGVTQRPAFGGVEYTHFQDAYGLAEESGYHPEDSMTDVTASENNGQVIILRYYRTSRDEVPLGGYKVVHEYYTRTDSGDVLDGISEISAVGGLPLDGKPYTSAGVARRNRYNGAQYAYFQSAYGLESAGSYTARPDMAFVVATGDGQQIIILRYLRLPDPNDPDSPEEITIWEDDVPKTYIKIWDPEEEEYFYVPEDEVPLAPPVQTGRAASLFGLCAGLGLAAAVLLRKRKNSGK